MSEEKVIKNKARGYARITSIQEFEEGNMLDGQSARIEEYCTLKDLELITIYKDCEIDDHSGMQELLDDIQEDEYIIVFDLLSLVMRECLNMMDIIEKKNAHFVCLSHTPGANDAITKCIYTIYHAINERDTNIEKSKGKRRR